MPDYTPNFAGIVDALKTIIQNGIGGGGSGGATQAQIKTAIETATNLDEVETTVSQVRDRLMPAGTFSGYTGTSAGANLKASAGTVYAFSCSNNNSVVAYFQLFNKASAAVPNDVPILCFPVGFSDSLLIVGQDFCGGAGFTFTAGISWGFSTTRTAYTAGVATDCIATVRWA
jgi:DNA-binding LacI/PurR family transcriptional regulator